MLIFRGNLKIFSLIGGMEMKKIVRGKVLDTETAEIVKKITFGEFGDATGYEETLYVSPEGAYFIYTNGGSESKYPFENITLKYQSSVDKWLKDNK
jgi:hypothetical protein